jgi:hypothetical protein
MRMKGYPVLAVLFFGLAGSVFGQQITRIAVVDLGRIIMTYSRDGAALKDFELKKSQIQTEIDRMSEEIRRLQAQKVEADRIGDRQGAQRLESDIFRKTELLRDFVRSNLGDGRLFAGAQPEKRRFGDGIGDLVQPDDRYHRQGDTVPHRQSAVSAK